MLRGDRLLVTIQNSGPRTSGSSAQNGRPSKGIGLANTGERLRTLYGDNQQFSLRSRDAGGYEVAIEIPFRKAIPDAQAVVACER